ncbi:hypothetical protein RUM44_006309 [Polyplax serrata]|uniref:Uncharacterized protein n=1 Tax=Polyplax serrata TaxID=468196 RepID=A0ABR1AHR9_POLSC
MAEVIGKIGQAKGGKSDPLGKFFYFCPVLRKTKKLRRKSKKKEEKKEDNAGEFILARKSSHPNYRLMELVSLLEHLHDRTRPPSSKVILLMGRSRYFLIGGPCCAGSALVTKEF